MNYEKKYKEALSVAKGIHHFSSDIAEIKRMERIFPELAESEDERIRKTLLETFSNFDADGTFWTTILRISKDNVLDWLKKQNPVKFDEKDEKIRKELLDSFKYQQRESRTDKEWLNGIKLSEVLAWLEKQGKTVMETIPIKSNPQVVCPYCKNTNSAYIDGHWFCANCYRDFYLKWSEEDDGVVACIKNHLKQYLNDVAYISYKRWFDSLKQRMEEQQ